MALLNIRKINPVTYLGFWEITESPDELRKTLLQLTENQLTIPDFNSINRQIQWLSSRVLAYTVLQRFTSAFIPLQNNSNGKPIFLDDVYQISITHSHKLVGVMVSQKHKVGIDIEFISPKVLRVADKFMAPEELADAGGDLEKTLIYWSAKETLYKLYSKKQLVFKDHLRIKPFGLQNAGILTTQITTPDSQNAFIVHYEKLTEYILTYSEGEQNDIN